MNCLYFWSISSFWKAFMVNLSLKTQIRIMYYLCNNMIVRLANVFWVSSIRLGALHHGSCSFLFMTTLRGKYYCLFSTDQGTDMVGLSSLNHRASKWWEHLLCLPTVFLGPRGNTKMKHFLRDCMCYVTNSTDFKQWGKKIKEITPIQNVMAIVGRTVMVWSITEQLYRSLAYSYF